MTDTASTIGLINILSIIVYCSALSENQKVKFIKNEVSKSSVSTRDLQNDRHSRSIIHYDIGFGSPLDIWDEILTPDENYIYHIDHLHPLIEEHPPVIFLQHPQMNNAKIYILYHKGLYFEDIPHEKLLRMLQERRRHMGLKPNKLGSLSPHSSFYRKNIVNNHIYWNLGHFFL